VRDLVAPPQTWHLENLALGGLDPDPEAGVNELSLGSFVTWLVGCGFAYGFDGHRKDLVDHWLP
jgi:hypothetical protein